MWYLTLFCKWQNSSGDSPCAICLYFAAWRGTERGESGGWPGGCLCPILWDAWTRRQWRRATSVDFDTRPLVELTRREHSPGATLFLLYSCILDESRRVSTIDEWRVPTSVSIDYPSNISNNKPRLVSKLIFYQTFLIGGGGVPHDDPQHRHIWFLLYWTPHHITYSCNNITFRYQLTVIISQISCILWV
jgi:hypothetical protein